MDIFNSGEKINFWDIEKGFTKFWNDAEFFRKERQDKIDLINQNINLPIEYYRQELQKINGDFPIEYCQEYCPEYDLPSNEIYYLNDKELMNDNDYEFEFCIKTPTINFDESKFKFNIILSICEKLRRYAENDIFQYLISTTRAYDFKILYQGIKLANEYPDYYLGNKLEFINQTYFKVVYSRLLIYKWLIKIFHNRRIIKIATLLTKSKLNYHIILDFVEFSLIKHGRSKLISSDRILST